MTGFEIGGGATLIISIAVFLFILYIIIETAVRRGIDSSKTSQMLKDYMEKQKNDVGDKERDSVK